MRKNLSNPVKKSIRVFALTAVDVMAALRLNSFGGVVALAQNPKYPEFESALKSKFDYNKKAFSYNLQKALNRNTQIAEVREGLESIGISFFNATLKAALLSPSDQQIQAVIVEGSIEMARVSAVSMGLPRNTTLQLLSSVAEAVSGALCFCNVAERLNTALEPFIYSYNNNLSPKVIYSMEKYREREILMDCSSTHILALATAQIAIRRLGKLPSLKPIYETAMHPLSCYHPPEIVLSFG